LVLPRDIAIAGFGNYEMASVSDPGIATINVDSFVIGAQAAEQMIAMLENRSAAKITKTGYNILRQGST
jgi:LacI family gluconate utilization system Gnt-I transcriptional repressor